MERVRAIIIKEDEILLINRIKPEENYWVIPGGKVEEGETHYQALIRECQEELGVIVTPVELLTSFANSKPGLDDYRDYFYICKCVSGKVGTGTGPELEEGHGYVGKYLPLWVNLSDLNNYKLYPTEIIDKILQYTNIKPNLGKSQF